MEPFEDLAEDSPEREERCPICRSLYSEAGDCPCEDDDTAEREEVEEHGACDRCGSKVVLSGDGLYQWSWDGHAWKHRCPGEEDYLGRANVTGTQCSDCGG
jgi:hypothetical protein